MATMVAAGEQEGRRGAGNVEEWYLQLLNSAYQGMPAYCPAPFTSILLCRFDWRPSGP